MWCPASLRPTPSALPAVAGPLFEGFVTTTGSSDFPATFMLEVRPLAFSSRSGPPSVPKTAGISRFSRKLLPCVHELYDRAGPKSRSRSRDPSCGLPLHPTASASWIHSFAARSLRPHVPLSTLRHGPCGPPRMTRGHHGSLLLWCKTLSFSAACRFIPAHWVSCKCGVPLPPASSPWVRLAGLVIRHPDVDNAAHAVDPHHLVVPCIQHD